MNEQDEKDIARLAKMQADDAEHLKAANELSRDWDWRKSVLAYWAEAYARPALEWAIKPGHDEPDDYTRLACTQFRADEALDKLNELLAKRTKLKGRVTVCKCHDDYVCSACQVHASLTNKP